MMAMAIGLTSHSFCLTNLFPYAGYMVRSMGMTDDKDAAGESSAIIHELILFVVALKFRSDTVRRCRESRLTIVMCRCSPEV